MSVVLVGTIVGWLLLVGMFLPFLWLLWWSFAHVDQSSNPAIVWWMLLPPMCVVRGGLFDCHGCNSDQFENHGSLESRLSGQSAIAKISGMQS